MSVTDFPIRAPPKLSIKVESVRPLRQHTLRLLCTVLVVELRIRFLDLAVHESHGQKWASFPARPQINRDGVAIRDDRGKIAYFPVLQFTDPNTRAAFSDRVIEALTATYPHAFDDGSAP